jgi:hypothetical protein
LRLLAALNCSHLLNAAFNDRWVALGWKALVRIPGRPSTPSLGNAYRSQ